MSVVKLKPGAIFIADAHYNINRTEVIEFLQNTSANQIVLMGDIFDFLCSQVDFWIEQNSELIDLINTLSINKEVIFLEGNHDYNIEELFPCVIVVPRSKQPLIVDIGEKKFALSHGDIFSPTLYNIYTYIIRNPIFLEFLNTIDIKNWLTRKIDTWLKNKDICSCMKDFDSFAIKRLQQYRDMKVDGVIEGHYHQGKIYKKYINIPSYACNESLYGIIDYDYQIKWKKYE